MVMSFDKIWNSKCCKDMTQDERWNIYGSWFKVNGSNLTLMEN